MKKRKKSWIEFKDNKNMLFFNINKMEFESF